MIYGNYDKIKLKLKWIDIDDMYSQLILDNPAQEIIAELKFNIQIPTKCYWSSFNHVTRRHENTGRAYLHYDYLSEREKAKESVINDLINECQRIVQNTKGLMKKLEDILM